MSKLHPRSLNSPRESAPQLKHSPITRTPTRITCGATMASLMLSPTSPTDSAIQAENPRRKWQALRGSLTPRRTQRQRTPLKKRIFMSKAKSSQLKKTPENGPGMFTCDTGITPGQSDDVLVPHGASFKIEPYTGQSHCGVIRYLAADGIIDLTKEEEEPIDPKKPVTEDDAESLARDIFSSTHTAIEEADVLLMQ